MELPYIQDIVGDKKETPVAPFAKAREKSTAYEILGIIDAIKVRSSMTLFDHIMPNAIFAEVLDAFYNSQRDELTLNLFQKSFTD